MATWTPEAKAGLAYEWRAWGRPKQFAPEGDWRIWLFLAGRGSGKSRAGAEWVREEIESGRRQRIALVAPTSADVRDVMVKGISGILSVSPPWNRPEYIPSIRTLRWANGAEATTFSADEPDRLRGYNFDGAWCDELASWRYLDDSWNNLLLCMRHGADPRLVATTTPRPIPLLKSLANDRTCHVTRSSTYENAVNLAPSFLSQIVTRYEGTRLGRQELLGEMIEDVEGALWTRDRLEACRVTRQPDQMTRIVVAIDPPVSHGEGAADAGIIVVGRGRDGHGYVLEDASLNAPPDAWARRAVRAYQEWKADRVVAEANQGGDMVMATLRTVDRTLPVTLIHASRGKQVRAEPVSALYEQGKVHHVGAFPVLEDQLCSWTADSGQKSPDRLDALVHALTELMLTRPATVTGTPVTVGGGAWRSEI